MTVASYEALKAGAVTGAINFASKKADPPPVTAMTVDAYKDMMAARKDAGNLTEPPSYEIQMLTRDPCLVTQLRVKPLVFQKYIANFLNISEKRLVIVPPLLSTDGPPTPPPGVPGPGPAPAPAPVAPAPAGAPVAAAGGAAGGNRPWVAWWMIKILPPNASLPIPKLLTAVNHPDGGLTRILPLTFARMPNLPHPDIDNHGTFSILPDPVDTSHALGYNPGGFRSGKTGEPMGPIKMLRDPEEIALKSLDDSLQTTGMIDELEHRVENASQMHYKTLSFQPYKAPDIIPPMVVSDGPDGIHTESPYGPWPWGPPPHAGFYNKPDMKEPSAITLSAEEMVRAGGLGQLIKTAMATPLPPTGLPSSSFLQRARASPTAPPQDEKEP